MNYSLWGVIKVWPGAPAASCQTRPPRPLPPRWSRPHALYPSTRRLPQNITNRFSLRQSEVCQPRFQFRETKSFKLHHYHLKLSLGESYCSTCHTWTPRTHECQDVIILRHLLTPVGAAGGGGWRQGCGGATRGERGVGDAGVTGCAGSSTHWYYTSIFRNSEQYSWLSLWTLFSPFFRFPYKGRSVKNPRRIMSLWNVMASFLPSPPLPGTFPAPTPVAPPTASFAHWRQEVVIAMVVVVEWWWWWWWTTQR